MYIGNVWLCEKREREERERREREKREREERRTGDQLGQVGQGFVSTRGSGFA
jgi:hypothetical protein